MSDIQTIINRIEARGWVWFLGTTSNVWRDGSRVCRALVGTVDKPLGEAEDRNAGDALKTAYERAALQRETSDGN